MQVWHALLRRVLGRPRHPVWVAALHLWLHVQRPRSTEAARGDLVTRDTNLALCLQNEVVEAAVVRMEGLGQPHLNDRSAELRRHVAQTPPRLPLSVRGRHLQNAVVEEVDSKHAQRHQAVVKLMRSSHGRRRQTGPQTQLRVFMVHDRRRRAGLQAVMTRYIAQSCAISR